MRKLKNILLIFCLGLLVFACSKDNGGGEEAKKGSFEYTVTGAASKTVTGNNAKFGPTGSFGQTFISLTSLIDGTNELDIKIVVDPAVPGTYLVNPRVTKNSGGQIVNHPIEEGDSWVDLGIGSTLGGDRRGFATNGANGGSVTVTSVDADKMVGTFSVSMMELLGGNDVFNNPKITVKGSFTAVKQ